MAYNPKIIIREVEEESIDEPDETILDAIKNKMIWTDKILELLKNISNMDTESKYNSQCKRCYIKRKHLWYRKMKNGVEKISGAQFFSVICCWYARYGHMALKCENNGTCFKCAGPHKPDNCLSLTFKSINCYEPNKKLKKVLKADHQVSDFNWACFERLDDFEMKKTKSK